MYSLGTWNVFSLGIQKFPLLGRFNPKHNDKNEEMIVVINFKPLKALCKQGSMEARNHCNPIERIKRWSWSSTKTQTLNNIGKCCTVGKPSISKVLWRWRITIDVSRISLSSFPNVKGDICALIFQHSAQICIIPTTQLATKKSPSIIDKKVDNNHVGWPLPMLMQIIR